MKNYRITGGISRLLEGDYPGEAISQDRSKQFDTKKIKAERRRKIKLGEKRNKSLVTWLHQ